MAMPMAPPQFAGYSLKVKLFSPSAHDTADKPIRCFRVVTSPEVSIREFCEEASRIHDINYGEPLPIKKCQDDEGFDVTQSEILGNLFANAATIRMIKASAGSGVRDSVPPTSALRFDPTSRKRVRESSPTVNGSAPSNSYKPNKRQRLTDLDPDHPLPSRESEPERERARPANSRVPDINVVPSSQESVILGTNYGFQGASRQVRPDLRQIPETPEASPSPPPESQRHPFYENHSTNHQARKPAIPNHEASNHHSEAENSSPLKQATARAQSYGANQSRAKSASYHIQRATERGTSVSTAATSPLSVDQQISARNGLISGTKRKVSDSSASSGGRHGKQASRSSNEDSIYENIVSDDEASAILQAKKATLKIRRTPNSGLPGTEWANKQFNTPPNGRRNSRPRDQAPATPGELPLTPHSKEREEKQQKSAARKAQQAAAEAAEQRKREADEARAVEEQRIAEEDRARREEQERIEIEEFKRGEAERAAKELQQKEKEERERKGAEEARRREGEQQREAERKKEEERLEKERAAKQKEEDLKRNKALLAEATQKREEQERLQAEKAAEEAKQAKEKASSPELARISSPANGRPQSSTSFMPKGRKSALKPSLYSSQAIASSSPIAPSPSPELSTKGVGLDAQMPIPKNKVRRVSFEEPPKRETPIRPSSRPILPPSKSITPIPVPKPATVKPVQKTEAGSDRRQSYTPIPIPSTLKRPSNERSMTPIVPPKVAQPRKEATPQPAPKKSLPAEKETTPQTSAKKSSPPIVPAAKKNATALQPPTKEKSRSVEPPTEEPEDAEESSDEESDEDVPSKVDASNAATQSASESESESEAEQDEDEAEVASNASSGRDSRSPVTFSQHQAEFDAAKQNRSASPESASGSEDEQESDSSENNDASDKESENNDASEDEASDEEEEAEIQVPESSPTLPMHKPAVKATVNHQVNSKDNTIERDTSTSTQGEIDQQLTSSIFEVRRPNPASSPPQRGPPALKVGASLQALNSKKPAFSSSAKNSTVKASQLQTLKEASGSEDESEEESDDASSDSDEDEETARHLSSAFSRSPNKPKPKPVDSDSDSSADSDSESEAENVDTQTQIRNELAAQIASFGSNDSQKSTVNIPSPKIVRGTQEVKPKSKYLSGYSFSQPGL